MTCCFVLDIEMGETKFVSPEVHYLKEATRNFHWDVVLMCEDGVTYRTSRLVLAAMCPAVRGTMLANMDEDIVSVYVESHSTPVLQFLQFIHTGCLFTRSVLRILFGSRPFLNINLELGCGRA